MKISPSPSFASSLVVPVGQRHVMARGRRRRTNGLDTIDQREPLTWCFVVERGKYSQPPGIGCQTMPVTDTEAYRFVAGHDGRRTADVRAHGAGDWGNALYGDWPWLIYWGPGSRNGSGNATSACCA